MRIALVMLVFVSGVLGQGPEKVILDVKVPLEATADLAPAQAGLTMFLMRSDWAVVSELGEQYEVWLKDFDRRKNLLGMQVITLLVEIREPALMRKGNLVKQLEVTIRYWPGETSTDKYDHQILNELSAYSMELQVEAYHVGKALEAKLQRLLK